MKKSVFKIVISITILLGVLLWFLSSKTTVTGMIELVEIGILFLLVGFGLFIGITRLISAKKGEPVEDELSKKMMTKASSIAFYASLYMWLLLMFFGNKLKLANDSIIGYGIVCMAVIFAISWITIKLTGFRDE